MSATEIANGKLPAELLARLLAGFGPPPGDVIQGPAPGEDACAVAVGGGVLVAATDPITLTSADVGRYAVIVNANDVATCGVRPQWFLASVLLPARSREETVEEIFRAIADELDHLGVALVGGHTEVTSAVNQPVVVGHMLGFRTDGRFISTGGASVGDVLVQIGPAPVEGAAILAGLAGAHGVAADVVEAAHRATRDPGISVVDGALAAADLGATSMHDPTEGGLAAGLHELAEASGVAVVVDRDQVTWFSPALEVCRAVGADPWATIASGCLLATFPPGAAQEATAALGRMGLATAVLGALESGSGVRDRAGVAIPFPARDEVARLLD